MGHLGDTKRSVKWDGYQKGKRSCKKEGIGNFYEGKTILWKIIIKYDLLEKNMKNLTISQNFEKILPH